MLSPATDSSPVVPPVLPPVLPPQSKHVSPEREAAVLGHITPQAPGDDDEDGGYKKEQREKFVSVDMDETARSCSSYLETTRRYNKGRLCDDGYWSPLPGDAEPWYQLDLAAPVRLGGIAVKGANSNLKYYVKKLVVRYSLEGKKWLDLPAETIPPKQGEACCGEGSPYWVITQPFRCRYVRVLPLEWEGYVCLRVGVLMTESDAWEYERSKEQNKILRELNGLRCREEGYVREVEDLREDAVKMRGQVEQLESRLSATTSHSRTQDELASLRERQLLAEIETLQVELSGLRSANVQLSSVVESLPRELAAIEEDKPAGQDEVTLLHKKLEEANAQNQILLRDMRLLRSDLEHAHREKLKAREDVELFQNMLVTGKAH